MLFFFFTFFCFAQPLSAHATSAIIIDSDGKHAYYYDTLNQIAQSCNFNCHYKNLYDILEEPTIDPCHSVAFIFISNALLHKPHHAITKEFMHAIISFINQKNHTVLFFLPSNVPLKMLSSFLSHISLPSNIDPASLAQLYLHHISIPNAQSGQLLGTSLINAHPNKKVTRSSIKKKPSNVIFLPHKAPCSSARITHPFAVALYDKKKNNIIACAPSLEITFADIAENFHKNPHDIQIRDQFLVHAQHALCELQQLHTKHSITDTGSLQLPHALRTHPTVKKRKLCSAAWLEPKDFYLHEMANLATPEQKKEALTAGCSFLHDSNFDLLWFEVNPEWYFSPRALFKKDKDSVMSIMKNIGTQLKAKCTKKMPSIYIGSDITSNFNGQKPPNCISDIWGTKYPNVPCCLDIENIWQQEVIEPFKKTYELLHHDLPINGLFLDFEMYHAPQQASSYHDLMDFSDYTWDLFRKKEDSIPLCATVHERVQYLKKNKLFKKYLFFLEQSAEKIGCLLRKEIQKIDPTLQIATYAPTLPSSWFYRGILRGLSTKHAPTTCATFNTDYMRHKKWLSNQNIHLTHGTALMLSKLTNDANFNFAQKLNRHHDFIWYNRPSRQIYKLVGLTPRNEWWISEYSPMEIKKLTQKLFYKNN